jgi:hypothetical protein
MAVDAWYEFWRHEVHLPIQSVNHQVICEELTPCHYGTAILRHIHFIVHLCLRHPTSRILQTKTDCKATSKCLHFDPKIVYRPSFQWDPFYWWCYEWLLVGHQIQANGVMWARWPPTWPMT